MKEKLYSTEDMEKIFFLKRARILQLCKEFGVQKVGSLYVATQDDIRKIEKARKRSAK